MDKGTSPNDPKKKRQKKFPEGTWLAIGTSMGFIIGVAMDNIAVGFSIGITTGVIFEYFYGELFKE